MSEAFDATRSNPPEAFVRVWAVKEQRWHWGFMSNVMLSLDGVPCWQFAYDAPKPCDPKEFIVQRCLLKKDVVGVMMFEGDIVAFTNERGHVSHGYLVFDEGEVRIMTYESRTGRNWTTLHDALNYVSLHDGMNGLVRVVGNVEEHYELLPWFIPHGEHKEGLWFNEHLDTIRTSMDLNRHIKEAKARGYKVRHDNTQGDVKSAFHNGLKRVTLSIGVVDEIQIPGTSKRSVNWENLRKHITIFKPSPFAVPKRKEAKA